MDIRKSDIKEEEMDIDALKAFRYVVEFGTISQAAERLNYSQSNVTMKIAKLEEQLQTKLLHRHNRGCEVTAKGKDLYEHALQIFIMMERAENAMQDEHAPRGSLQIGSIETTAAIHLPNVLMQYHQSCPDVLLHVRTQPTAMLIEQVLQYQMDGAFISGPLEHSLLGKQLVLNEELVLIYAKGNKPVLENTTILVFRSGCSYRFQIEKYLREESIKTYQIMEMGSLEAILGCVHVGLGVTLLPKSVFERYTRYFNLENESLPQKYREIPTEFIYRKDNPSMALRYFLNMLVEYPKKNPV